MEYTNMTMTDSHKYLWAILLLALFLRLGYVFYASPEIHWEDEYDYLALSQNIASGAGFVDKYGAPTAFRPVGYPLLLAGFHLLGLGSVPVIRLIQVFLSVVTVWLTFLLAAHFINRKIALWAAFFAAIYPYFIFLPTTLMSETWFSLLLLAGSYFYLKSEFHRHRVYAGVSGVLMGLAVLTRPSALVLIFAILLWTGLRHHFNLRSILPGTALFAGMVAIIIVPWMMRNQVHVGAFQLSSNAGRNLWLGNNPKSTINTGSNIEMSENFHELIESRPEFEADKIYKERALAFMKNNPQHVLWLSVKKGLSLWRFGPSPTTEGYVDQNSWHWWISFLSYGPIFLLAIAGFLTASNKVQSIMLLWIFYALAFTAVHAVFISKVRFRLPLDYFLMIMAALALQKIFEVIKQMKSPKLMTAYK